MLALVELPLAEVDVDAMVVENKKFVTQSHRCNCEVT